MRIFGEIEGVAVGTEFASRAELAASGVHRPTQAGICGSSTQGAESIVVSGGYEDDEDHGDYIIYGGQAGSDPANKHQLADAELSRGNLALVVSFNNGLPVRVTRGLGSGQHIYRYDGLYRVEKWWVDKGKSGFRIFRFGLRKIDDKPISIPSGELPLNSRTGESDQVASFTTRIIRDTQAAQWVKRLHDYHCQACSVRIERPGGAYAEAAYLKPPGRPHLGPDTPDNILCLCPNCHVMFDGWAFSVREDGTLIGALEGILREQERHGINRDFLSYHHRLFEAASKHWQAGGEVPSGAADSDEKETP